MGHRFADRYAYARHILPCSPASPSLPSRPKRWSAIRTPSTARSAIPSPGLAGSYHGVDRRPGIRAPDRRAQRRLHGVVALIVAAGRQRCCRASRSRPSRRCFPGLVALILCGSGEHPAGAAQPRRACARRGHGLETEGLAGGRRPWPTSSAATPKSSTRPPSAARRSRAWPRISPTASWRRCSGWCWRACRARLPTRRSTPPTA